MKWAEYIGDIYSMQRHIIFSFSEEPRCAKGALTHNRPCTSSCNMCIAELQCSSASVQCTCAWGLRAENSMWRRVACCNSSFALFPSSDHHQNSSGPPGKVPSMKMNCEVHRVLQCRKYMVEPEGFNTKCDPPPWFEKTRLFQFFWNPALRLVLRLHIFSRICQKAKLCSGCKQK